MRLLLIGGTRFVGKHIVEAALTAGHEVTLFHRGHNGTDLFPNAEHLLGDRDTELGALAGRSWDATIDTCAYVPRQVHMLADTLGARGGHYVNISSVSVYDYPPLGYDESAAVQELDDPTVEEITGETYGGLKVLCERAALQRFGGSTLIVRPTYVVGPDDYSWRFPWWVQRFAAGGDILAPGPADDPAQVIDARDMAAWIVAMVAAGGTGVFHAVGPETAITWGTLLETISATVSPAGTTLTWLPAEFLSTDAVSATAFPMWAGGDPAASVSAADPGAALRAGLVLRPLAETIADTLSWVRSNQRPPTVGLDPAAERSLLEQWRQA